MAKNPMEDWVDRKLWSMAGRKHTVIRLAILAGVCVMVGIGIGHALCA